MKTVRITWCALLSACITSTAVGQYGLYGSPETLPAYQPYAQAAAYPPAAQAAPQYRYPAQVPAAATYQPYQPGAQYQYPAPHQYPAAPNRVAMRTAAVEQPTMIPTPQAMPVEPVPQGSGVTDQILAEQNYNDAYNGGCGVYRGTGCGYEPSACGPGACDLGCQPYCCPWYASVSALALTRSDGRRFWTSYLDGREDIQLSNSQVELPWKWGGEVELGRRFCCGCTPYALEAAFWTTESFTGSQVTDLYSSDGLYVGTPLNISNINFNIPGVGDCPATLFFNGARSHTVTRRDEFYNFEINLLREQMAWACDSPWDIGWSVGVRYFRFQDALTYSTVSHDGDYNAYFKDTATNNLIGVQFGFDAAYNVVNNLRLFIAPRVGIYDNFLDSNFQAQARQGNGAYVDGTVDVPNPAYTNFPVSGTGNGIAFLTQVDLGADWQFSRNWSARVGYRVVALTGMALADDQFPQYMCDTPEMRNPQHYSSLVLHGAFLGATYNF